MSRNDDPYANGFKVDTQTTITPKESDGEALAWVIGVLLILGLLFAGSGCALPLA